MNLDIVGPEFNCSKVCEPILRDLPEWFGIESAIVQFLHEIDNSPTFLASQNGETVGFISLKQYFSQTAEISVMGVKKTCRGNGIGHHLMQAAETYLTSQGVKILQVKTLGPSDSDPNYAQTRAFYTRVGFLPLEEFKQIWDENNPCLIMVKAI